MNTKRKPRAKSRVPATKKAAKGKLSGNMGKWIWIGAAAIGVIVLMSSFKSSVSKLTQSECAANAECVRDYWRYRINTNADWKAGTQTHATAGGRTYAQQLEIEVDYCIKSWPNHDLTYEFEKFIAQR